MNQTPRKIPEIGLYRPVWAEFNRLIEYVREISPVGGRGINVNRKANGTTFTADIPRASAGASVQQYRLVSIENDFYSCKKWTGTAETGDEIYIARPFEHMVSNWNGQSIVYSSDGDAFTATYTYTSATKRTKTIAGVAEIQVLTPYFKSANQLIFAIELSGKITSGPSYTPLTDPNDAPITLIDLNRDGRAWTKY